MTRQVTELDFREPKYRNAKVEDYEFRPDGALVRKDRWENAIRNIVETLGMNGRDFECRDVAFAVRRLVANMPSVCQNCGEALSDFEVSEWGSYCAEHAED